MKRGRLADFPGGTKIRVIWQWIQIKRAVTGSVTIGKSVRLGSGSVLRSMHGLVIEDFVAIGRNCTIEVNGRIGYKTIIAANVGVVGRTDHDIDEVGTAIVDSTWVGDRELRDSDITDVGCDVWVGYGATILSGCRVGDGAVIAAGSVVTRDVAPFAIVAGVPAREVGMRFDSEAARREHLENLRSQRTTSRVAL